MTWRRRKSSRCRLVSGALGAAGALVFAALSRASFWRIMSSIFVSTFMTSDARFCSSTVGGGDVGVATPGPGGALVGVVVTVGVGFGSVDGCTVGAFEGSSRSANAFWYFLAE